MRYLPNKIVSSKKFALILISLLVFVIYGNSIFFDFTNWDDDLWIRKNENIRSFSNIVKIFNPLEVPYSKFTDYLPIRDLTHMVEYSIWKLNPMGYHAVNLLLYIVCVILAYFLALKITKKTEIAIITSLIFAVHPIHVESVTWLAGRKDLLFLIFYILSFISYLEYTEKNNRIFLLLSLGLFILSLFSKSMGITLPIILLVYNWTKGNVRLKSLLPFFLISFIFGLLFYSIYNTQHFVLDYHGGSFYSNFLLIVVILFKYLLLILFPHKLCASYLFELPTSIFDYRVIFSSLILLSFVLFIVKNKSSIYSFLILFFYISLIPVINIVPHNVLYTDRYLFLSSIAYALILSKIFVTLFENSSKVSYRIYLGITISSLITIFSLQTFFQNKVWENSHTLWSDVVKKSPKYADGYHNLALDYFDRNDLANALFYAKKACDINGKDPILFNQLGLIYFKLNENKKALSAFKKGISIDPTYSILHKNIAKVYLKLGSEDLAIKHYAIIFKGGALDFEVAYNLMVYDLKNDNYKRAGIMFDRLMGLLPSVTLNPKSYSELALIAKKLNKINEARTLTQLKQ